MGRQKHPQIVTANDLFEGDVIYLTGEGGWTRLHGDAAVAHDSDEAQRLLAVAQAQPDKIVGAYLADAAIDADGRPQPVHFREAFRTRGPSNYFHGKQAEV
ncbi:MAG: DUF2849 domain-containing protein [Roseitalea sp.]|uniref:DUF2849 domain-containing protein n=1 Tax=Oceaniradius stylonematis TaxID=2184161 RepID=A0A3A8AA31_9HYPH|nr:DUF2849 domain-containing protein [Oceaniradius stylonematis]MBO6554092.1 DUF2849 domain-containing protein [Roseitalea sp.]MBO6953136.1 DUF2849 domain-containing protein [Rhizobiaceae bacterium]MBO6593483.1 DUF2849 domain-containing protein [Roseitalea sp.]MBO6600879.1 DUF2849 domain-containing protein [Roseitalea sp.]MBO6612560.1 DUF2849 domain-containing protein [Roseitalea sp.]